jgi:hypothetical protein
MEELNRLLEHWDRRKGSNQKEKATHQNDVWLLPE